MSLDFAVKAITASFNNQLLDTASNSSTSSNTSLKPLHSPKRVFLPKSMAYANYTSDHELLEMQEWYEFSEVRRWVRALLSCPFHVKAARDNVRNSFLQLTILHAPFAKNVRFPSRFLVRMANTDVSNNIFSVLSTLDLPDRLMNKDHQVIDLNDPKRAFDVSVRQLMTMISGISADELSKVGIFNRSTFEARFELDWK